jgi:heavy metal sensor kinase
MTTRWQPRSVRVRLTLWHVAALLVVLALYASGVFALVKHNLAADLDRQLEEDLDRAEQSFRLNPDGTLAWRFADPDPDERVAEREGGPFICVWSRNGRLLYRDPAAPPVLMAPPTTERSEGQFATVSVPAGGWLRQLTGPQDVGGIQTIVRVARPEDRMRHELRSLLAVLLIGLPIAALLAGVGGYVVARRALAPVDRMGASARAITAARLSERLRVENPDDELGQLATVFNETFSRLEASFEQLRRFTADASHEMRTPLAALRTVGEVALREPRNERAWRDVVGSMLEEADRLNRLVESLLSLARADGAHVRLNCERLDLADLAREAFEHLGALAEEKQQAITVDAPGAVLVHADRVVLRQAVVNVLDNAIKYSPVGGHVSLVVATRPEGAVLEVRDSGPGIPPEDSDRIFDRFYRIDKGRSRDAGGIGLGLSIARWAVEVHGGRIDVGPAAPSGSVFRIVLPQ